MIPAANSFTVALGSETDPTKVGRLTFVMPSGDEVPLSLAALSVGGRTPFTEPTGSDSAGEGALVFPAMSVAVAVMWCSPVPRALPLIEYAPPVAGPLPIGSPSEKSETSESASAVPVKNAPTDADSGCAVFGTARTAGAAVSVVIVSAGDAGDAAPLSGFAAVTVIACVPSATAVGSLIA